MMDQERVITLKDLETRYANIRRRVPKIKNCSVANCKNPRDFTPMGGKETTCSYHRLLFDWWICDVVADMGKMLHYFKSSKGRRRAFTNWRNKTGKEACDKIVLDLAQSGISWEC